jgi:acyl transferase domain-containing protein
VALRDVAYTLQVGREAMEHRLGVAVRTFAQLEEKLGAWLQPHTTQIENCYYAEIKKNKEMVSAFNADEDLQGAIAVWAEKGKHDKLLELWVKGLSFDWRRLYAGRRPRRVSLPTYPFAKERHWPQLSDDSSGGDTVVRMPRRDSAQGATPSNVSQLFDDLLQDQCTIGDFVTRLRVTLRDGSQ